MFPPQLGQLDTFFEEDWDMNKCSHKNCKFRTSVSGRMQHHIATHHNGQLTASSAREFRGHLAVRGKKK